MKLLNQRGVGCAIFRNWRAPCCFANSPSSPPIPKNRTPDPDPCASHLVVSALIVLLAASSVPAGPVPVEAAEVRIGSKAFTESVVLGELIGHLAESAGARPIHRRRLGGTQVLWNALLEDQIDIYAEYTGTIREEILAGQGIRDDDAIRQALIERGVQMSRPLGFNNTYAIGMRAEVAKRLGIR